MCDVIKVDFKARALVSSETLENVTPSHLMMLPTHLRARAERDVKLFGHCSDPDVINAGMDEFLSKLAEVTETGR